MRSLGPILSIALITACHSVGPEGSRVAPNHGASSECELVVLELEPEKISYDEAAGTATLSPGSDIKRAAYVSYVLEIAELEAIAGGRPTEVIQVRAQIIRSSSRRLIPEDPGKSAPIGGFSITEHRVAFIDEADDSPRPPCREFQED